MSRISSEDPDHIRAQNNRKYYMQIIDEEIAAAAAAAAGSHVETGRERAADSRRYEPHGDPVNVKPQNTYKTSDEFQTYERLCRGEKTQQVRCCRLLINKPHTFSFHFSLPTCFFLAS